MRSCCNRARLSTGTVSELGAPTQPGTVALVLGRRRRRRDGPLPGPPGYQRPGRRPSTGRRRPAPRHSDRPPHTRRPREAMTLRPRDSAGTPRQVPVSLHPAPCVMAASMQAFSPRTHPATAGSTPAEWLTKTQPCGPRTGRDTHRRSGGWHAPTGRAAIEAHRTVHSPTHNAIPRMAKGQPQQHTSTPQDTSAPKKNSPPQPQQVPRAGRRPGRGRPVGASPGRPRRAGPGGPV